MKPVIIGIAGGSGSGKSTLARNLLAALEDAVLITHDDYYKEGDHGPDFNYDHPSAFDNELLCEHLSLLAEGISVSAPTYDYTIHQRSSETKELTPHPIIILEGILVLENEGLRNLFDLKVFVDTPEEERYARRLRRDVRKRGRTPESVEKQFKTTVKPMHDLFVEPCKFYADELVIGGGKDPEVVARVADRVLQIKKLR